METCKWKSLIVMMLLTTFCLENTLGQTLEKAIRLTRGEQYTAAGKIYRNLLAKKPGSPEICFYYGDNFLQKYYSDTAFISFEEVEDSANILFGKGIQYDSLFPLNFIGLGEIRLINRDTLKAQEYFQKAFGLLPSKTNKKVKMNAGEQALVYIRIADAYVKAGIKDSTWTLDLLQKAEILNPRNYELFIVFGDASLFLFNNGSQAITYYNQAVSLKPASLRANLRLGQLWERAGIHEKALASYKEVLKTDSNYAPAYRELGFLFSQMNNNAEAKKYFEKFFTLSKSNITARISYINTLMELEDYNEAIRQVNTILKVDSTRSDFYRALAYSCYETGRYEKGLAAMDKFFSLASPNKVRTTDQVYYARLLSKTKQDSLAGEIFMNSYKADSLHTEYLDEALMAFIRAKVYPRALDALLTKIRAGNTRLTDHYTLGKLYYNLRDYKKADSALSIYNEKDSTNIMGYVWRAYSLVNLDPEAKEGLAKPVFDIILEKGSRDPEKYSKNIKDAYSYYAYYYLVRFIQTKDQADGRLSRDYCNKVLEIDPDDEKAAAILKMVSKSLQ